MSEIMRKIIELGGINGHCKSYQQITTLLTDYLLSERDSLAFIDLLKDRDEDINNQITPELLRERREKNIKQFGGKIIVANEYQPLRDRCPEFFEKTTQNKQKEEKKTRGRKKLKLLNI